VALEEAAFEAEVNVVRAKAKLISAKKTGKNRPGREGEWCGPKRNNSQKFPVEAIQDAMLGITQTEEIERDIKARLEFAKGFGAASNSLSGGAVLPSAFVTATSISDADWAMTGLPERSDTGSTDTAPLASSPTHLGKTMGLMQSVSHCDSESASTNQTILGTTAGSEEVPPRPLDSDEAGTTAAAASVTDATIADPLGPGEASTPLPTTTTTTLVNPKTLLEDSSTPAPGPADPDLEERTPAAKAATPVTGDKQLADDQGPSTGTDGTRKRKRAAKKKKEASAAGDANASTVEAGDEELAARLKRLTGQ
jgi:hypothetical protein